MNEDTWDKMSLSERKAYVEKKDKINELLISSGDYIFQRFFDLESDEMLDEKFDVLTKLNNGVVPADIPNYYDVLENYPKNKMWD